MLSQDVVSERLNKVKIILIDKFTKIIDPIKMRCISCNSEFLERVSEIILKEIGEVSNKLTIHVNGKQHYLNYIGKRIVNILNWLYKDSEIYLNRKYDKYLDIINKIDELNKKDVLIKSVVF